MTSNESGTVLITGASSGIGAIYADRLARRGQDLILVARSRERLETVATHLAGETGRSIEVIAADLNNRRDLNKIEHRLRTDPSITGLVNNAGVSVPAPLLDNDAEKLNRIIDLNVTALIRLSHAVLPGFLSRGGGVIINIASEWESCQNC